MWTTGSIPQHPAVMQAQTALDRARQQLGYTVIRAPQDGVVTKVEQIQLGSYITAAQPLFWLVSGRPYVEADFKEDQLARMRPGQPAEIESRRLVGGRSFRPRRQVQPGSRLDLPRSCRPRTPPATG